MGGAACRAQTWASPRSSPAGWVQLLAYGPQCLPQALSARHVQDVYNSSAVLDAFTAANYELLSGGGSGYAAVMLSELLVQADQCHGPTWLAAMQLVTGNPQVRAAWLPGTTSLEPEVLAGAGQHLHRARQQLGGGGQKPDPGCREHTAGVRAVGAVRSPEPAERGPALPGAHLGQQQQQRTGPPGRAGPAHQRHAGMHTCCTRAGWLCGACMRPSRRVPQVTSSADLVQQLLKPILKPSLAAMPPGSGVSSALLLDVTTALVSPGSRLGGSDFSHVLADGRPVPQPDLLACTLHASSGPAGINAFARPCAAGREPSAVCAACVWSCPAPSKAPGPCPQPHC